LLCRFLQFSFILIAPNIDFISYLSIFKYYSPHDFSSFSK
jgi:hypothetical protein